MKKNLKENWVEYSILFILLIAIPIYNGAYGFAIGVALFVCSLLIVTFLIDGIEAWWEKGGFKLIINTLPFIGAIIGIVVVLIFTEEVFLVIISGIAGLVIFILLSNLIKKDSTTDKIESFKKKYSKK